MKLKNVLIVVKDIEKSRKIYHDLFDIDLVLDNDGNMILTEGLVLQDEKLWKSFLDRDIVPKSNSCELYFEEQDIEAFIVSGIRMAAQSKERISLFSDNAVYTMACKAAIKANRKLRTEEIDALLSELAAVKNPGTCPHGRPINVKYTKYEIERKFHRC